MQHAVAGCNLTYATNMAEDSDMAGPGPDVSEDDDIDYASDEKRVNVETDISVSHGLLCRPGSKLCWE